MKTVEFDVVFLSYDEPNADLHYADLCNKVPWAKRVHGVKGSDAAHKAAAELSDTDWLVTVDADNIVDPKFFNLEIDTDNPKIQVYSWLGRNKLNGLMYGNGGLKIWKKEFILNMKSHEASDSDRAQVDFCWEDGYQQFKECYSETIITGSPFQAWRAGFREGVKMVLDRGAKPSIDDFKERVASRNINNLTIWHNVGADVENGIWAIYGARLGTHMTMLTDWDYRDVADFDNYPALWEKYNRNDPALSSGFIGEELEDKLGLPMCTLDAEQSTFFKRHYNADKYNQGPLVKEMDVIRKIEGW